MVMAFMKNINDLIGILALLVLTTPSLVANIDCNGKPFHCLNSTHFMICVDLGSGVSSTIDDFVIPCPPTTVCKGTNKFECEFVAVTTTTIAPSVIPLTSVSEQTTPLYEVTTSIPFEEYYNTLSTTTLSEDILLTQHSATEPTIQPATDMLQNIDVTTSGSDLNSNFNDIVLSTNVQNNLTTLWPTVISSTLSEGITTAKTIAQNDFANLNTVTNTFLTNNVTESTLLQTKAASNVSTLSETIHSVDVVENDKNTDLMWATTELTPNEITSSVQNNQQKTTSLSNNVSTTASDLSSSIVEIASVAITKPDKDSSVTETTKSIETDQNEHTLLTTLDIAMPINTEAITEPYTTSIPEITENIKVTANISLSNNAADNATDSILLEASSSASVSEAISKGDIKNDTTTKFMLAGVTASTINKNTVNKSIPIVDVVQNSLKTIILLSKNVSVNAIYYATENTIVTETKPEMNLTLSEISGLDLVTTVSPINVDTTTTPIPIKYIPETSKNIDIITPEPGLTATSGLGEPLNTSFVNNITNIVIPPTLVVVSDSVQSLDVVQNNFTTHLINNAIKPILFEEAETTLTETKSETLKENTQNVDDVRNDFKVTESLSYDNSTNATDVISNATENVNVIMSRPEINKTLIDNSTFFSDTIKITESIMMEPVQTTPAPDIENKYLKISTTLFNYINDNVTEPIVYDVTENINLYESSLTLSVPALTTLRNVTVQSNFITKPVTDSTATNLPTTESINIPFTETVQTLPANLMMKITENQIHAATEYNADTSSESFSGQNTFYETDYIKPNNNQNKSVVQTKTEHTATTDNVLINSLVNEINKSSITSKNYNDLPDGNSTTEALVHAATENYADSSHISTVVTDSDSINFASSTLNTVLETTTFAQEVYSITYSHVNNHTDTENIDIKSDQRFTNKTGGKPTLSEKASLTGVVENTTITPTLNMINNNFTSSLVIATNATVPKLTSRTDIDTLIMNTEATLIVNQETHIQEDLVLRINTNDSVLSVSTFENYGSLNVNESLAPVLATSLEQTLKQTSVLTTEIPTGASDEAMVKPVSNDITLLSARNSTADSSTLSSMTANLPVTTADTIQVITTDPTTLGTIFTVTETSEVIFSETTDHVQAPHVLNTESAASQDFLPSSVYIDEASGTTLEASLKETNKSSLNTINDATTPFTRNTKMSMDSFYSAKEVVATEAVNNSNKELPLHSESSKSKLDKNNILTQITVPSLSAHNVPTQIVSTSEIQPTSVPLAVHLDFDTNLQKYETEQENSNPINPDPFASSHKTDLPVQNIVAVGTGAKKSESSLETSGKTLAPPSTASIGVEAIRKPNNVINLLLDSPTKQIPDVKTAAPTETISLISTAIPLETAADVVAAGELSKPTTETVPFADSRTEQDPDTESKINNMGANIQTAFPPKETLTSGDLHTLLNTVKETGVSTQRARNISNGHTGITPPKTSEKPIKHTQTLDVRTVPSIQVSDFQKPVIPSADTIERSKPYTHITSSLDATQTIVRVSRPYTEVPVTNDNTAHIVNRLNVDTDISNSKTEHTVVPKYVTPPSNIDEKLVIEVESTNRLTTESPSTIPHISESTVQTASKPILDTVTPDLGLVKIINISNKGSDFDLTTKHHIMSPKSEFTKVPKLVDQTTVHIKNSIGTNLDKDVLIMDSVKTEVPVLVQNNELTGTHLGISTLPKAKVQESENTEANESVQQPESPERNEGIQKTTSVIDRTITESSKVLDTNDKIPLERTIEMTTKKMEDNSERGDQSITNIESTVKSPALNFAETNLDDRSPKEKSVTNIHNTSLPIVKTVTNSQNFVCKLNKRGRFSDSNDCRKFYICIGKSEPIVGFCPNNTVFSELWKQCTKNLSHCVRNNQFQCVGEGRFSDFLNDKNYYICVKNNAGKFIRFKLQCQSGYHLNKTSVHCELNTESSQSTYQMSTSSVSINSGSDQSVSSVKSEKLVIESSNKFECKEEGKFPHADNCRKYYVCKKIGKSQYRRKSKKCNSDDLFDKDKKKCVDADSHECS